LERIVPLIEPGPKASQFIRQLKELVFRTSYRPLFHWYTSQLPKLSFSSPRQVELVEGLMRQHLVPWTSSPAESPDHFRTLISTHLHAGKRQFTARDLIRVVSTIGRAAKSDVIDALQHLWNASLASWPRQPPWTILDLSADPNRRLSPEKQRDSFELKTTKGDFLELPLSGYRSEFRLLKDVTCFSIQQATSTAFVWANEMTSDILKEVISDLEGSNRKVPLFASL
jgi:hypothetical protein